LQRDFDALLARGPNTGWCVADTPYPNKVLPLPQRLPTAK
jgi:hypothetical protein